MRFFSLRKKKKYATVSGNENRIEEIQGVAKQVTTGDEKKIVNNSEVVEKSPALWGTCPKCKESTLKTEIRANDYKCPKCDYYYKMTARARVNLLIDSGTFVELDKDIHSTDFLGFEGYANKIKEAEAKNKSNDAVVSGIGRMNGIEVSIAVMDFNFLGGSMGSVVGEKITRTLERALEKKIPAIVVASSGGARMYEGIVSLMQMAKTSAAVQRLKRAGVPFISVPVNPTTGGVTASFAMLGDVIISEPNALIGFAGQRVIEQTIKQKLPEGFQTSEFLLKHGMIDIIVKREEMKDIIAKVLSNIID